MMTEQCMRQVQNEIEMLSMLVPKKKFSVHVYRTSASPVPRSTPSLRSLIEFENDKSGLKMLEKPAIRKVETEKGSWKIALPTNQLSSDINNDM